MNGKVWVVGEQRGGNQRSLSLLITPWTAVSADRSYSSTLGKVEPENRRILVREAGAAKMGTLVRMHLCSFWFRCQLNRWSGQTMWGTQKDVIQLKKFKLKTNKQTKKVSKGKWPEDGQDIDVDTFFSLCMKRTHKQCVVRLPIVQLNGVGSALAHHSISAVQCFKYWLTWNAIQVIGLLSLSRRLFVYVPAFKLLNSGYLLK